MNTENDIFQLDYRRIYQFPYSMGLNKVVLHFLLTDIATFMILGHINGFSRLSIFLYHLMMKNLLFLLSLILLTSSLNGQKPAYKIFNFKGKKVRYQKMVRDLGNKDIVLFGEQHNNPITHWLQYEVTADLHQSKQLILGAEMLEADNQTILNDYLSGKITNQQLDSLARLWSNYETDYAPLVDFAKENGLPVVATNIPRRYANMVFKNGFPILNSLPDNEKEWMAPLPIPFDSTLVTYQDILNMMGDHGSPKLVKAQAMKDATMAHFILQNFVNGQLFIHYNGSFHSDKYEGILWYLKQARNDLKYSTISTVSQEDISRLEEEHYNLADYIICVDSNMTTTY